jgi:alanyl-tRNA synthetase
VLDKTPFYGEMGGQVGDSGRIVGDGFTFEVVDSQIKKGFTLHSGHLRSGEMGLGAVVTALAGLGSQILALRKSEPTLEDVFVELVGRGFADEDKPEPPATRSPEAREREPAQPPELGE